jgi:hypothetical protein
MNCTRVHLEVCGEIIAIYRLVNIPDGTLWYKRRLYGSVEEKTFEQRRQWNHAM